MDKKRLAYLLQQYAGKALTPAEGEELLGLIGAKSEEDALEEVAALMLAASGENIDVSMDNLQPSVKKIVSVDVPPVENGSAIVRQMPVRRRWLWAAASVVLLLSVGSYFLSQNRTPQVIARTEKKTGTDIQPGKNGAILTLADGKQIILDSAGGGLVAVQNGTQVLLKDGQLSYGRNNGEDSLVYNTISTPRGRQFTLMLADGTQVWLNAESSLKFPAQFSGNDRRVELSGEAYFEVAHNAARPFHVSVNDMDVQVLGTHFNINSYRDEPSVKTTLLEGRVKVEKSGRQVYLNPGQQAVLQPGGDNIGVAYDVDVDEVVAWKNGHFQYHSVDIETIMRQVARWYDVEVVYEKKTGETFSGGLPRSQNVSELLKRLEATGSVDFAINGKQIIVKEK